jgi:zinc protease
MTHSAGTGHSDILPFEATERTLGNGLKVIVVPTGFPNLVSVQIPVQTGSRNEVEPGKSGFAHFFEHMMFRGTERYPAHAYQEIITRSGARQNAYTTDDYTNYHVTFAKEDLEEILELEADRFMNLSYSEEDFKTEARAVLGEYNKNSADPLQKLIEVQREHAYSVHPYQHTTMGFIRDIEDMPNQFEYSKVFFQRWYRPEYTTIIVAGDVEPDAVVRLVEKYWGQWQPGEHRVEIPQEPEPAGPLVTHVPWPAETLPWVTVAFHGPAFSDTERDFAAFDVLLDLHFGETSEIYQRLVEQEQKVDQLFPYLPSNQDPGLATVLVRVKQLADATHVRDAILETFASARRKRVTSDRLDEAKSHNRYGFARTLDNSESIASTLARFVRFRRSYDTLNNLFRVYDSLTPEDLHLAGQRFISDRRLVVTTLSHEPLPESMGSAPSLETLGTETAGGAAPLPLVQQPSPSQLLRFKLVFTAGSAHDPAGKEGLAALAAEMVASAGSKQRRIDEINKALFPMAGSFGAQVDREMTTFTGVIHRDNLDGFADLVLKQLTEPGLRDDDFSRLRERQLNALVQDLRANNEEELAKERLQANVFAGTAYGHTALGTVAAIESFSIEDVRRFHESYYTRNSLTIGLAGDFPESFIERLQDDLSALPPGGERQAPPVAARRPDGLEVEIIEKETRATAISFGHPLEVTRSHNDFAALWVARSWLGEHRASQGRLFQRLREARGMNYGNYAYIEAFPGAMYQLFPPPNIVRRAQLFEIWVRPVVPENGAFALKAALHELENLITNGLTQEQFESTRNYLAKNVYVMLKTQEQQLGYALDSRWYEMGDFAETMRERLGRLTIDSVNAAIRRHLSAQDLSVVMVTKDGSSLRDQLLSEEPTTISYDSAKPEEILKEDEVIGARPLKLRPGAVRITHADEVFAK